MIFQLPHFVRNRVAFLSILVLISGELFANVSQTNGIRKKSEIILEKARTAIESDRYSEAEILIFKAIGIDSTNIKSYLFLSDVSDELGKSEQKKYALSKIVGLDSTNYPIAYKLLATLFFKEGDYGNALVHFNRYNQFKILKDSLLVSEKIKSCNFALTSLVQNRNVQISHLDTTVNTPLQEYWPVISTDDSLLYFTRLIKNEGQQYFERIFISQKQDSIWNESVRMNFSDDEEVNIGTMCLSADGKLLFFTACGRSDGRGSCDIFYARKVNNHWSKPFNAGFAINSNYWEAQPSVSSDDRFLFFASNRPGGLGGMDIWCSEITTMTNDALNFSVPINIGRAINSREDDFSPFIHADGSTLYFSSKGKFGMGGSDLFLSKLKDSVWTEAVNLGFPINTRFDEDGLAVSPTSNVAVFSSNREGSVEKSKDLFDLKLPSEFLPEKVGYIHGFVYDLETGLRLLAPIKLTQLESSKTKTIVSDQIEGYTTTLIAEKMYAFDVDVAGYLFYSKHFNLKEKVGFKQAEQVDIYLEPIKAGKKFVLSNIFFDFDSDRLKNESFAELIQLNDFLQKNSRLKVEISGHTDNVGNSDYNQKLSENRAKAIFDYLKQSVDPNRMIYKGYGAEIPVASNESEQGRGQNRRSEIKILSF